MQIKLSDIIFSFLAVFVFINKTKVLSVNAYLIKCISLYYLIHTQPW